MGKDTVFASLDSAANTAKDDIEFHRDNLKALYERNEGKPVAHFIEKVFAWRKDREHYQVLYEMFGRHAFEMANIGFLGQFCSFVSNLLDDTYWQIHWEKPKRTPDGDLVWENENRYIALEPASPTDRSAKPVVYRSGEGSQDFQALIDAVEAEIARRAARAAQYEADLRSVTFDYDV